MRAFLKNGNKLATLAVVGTSLAVLGLAGRAFLHHELGTLSMLIAGQAALFGIFFVPAVLAELSDRQTLSVYRSMYIGR